jgi:hypothetical protein
MVMAHTIEASRMDQHLQLTIEVASHRSTCVVKSIKALELFKTDRRIDLGRTKVESRRNE